MKCNGEHPGEGRTCHSGAEARADRPKLMDSTNKSYSYEVGGFTCGRPVRMAERLGEQLLTEVKALLNTRLRWAKERKWGVWTTELLYTSVSKPASSAGREKTDMFINPYNTHSKRDYRNALRNSESVTSIKSNDNTLWYDVHHTLFKQGSSFYHFRSDHSVSYNIFHKI